MTEPQGDQSAGSGGTHNQGNINNSGGVNILGGTVRDVYYTDNRGNPITRPICPVPPYPPDFFGGRDGPMSELKERLKAGQTVAITAVHGLGGIGKTTLAQQLANDLFYDEKVFRAVLWADVTRQPNPIRLLSGWASYAEPGFTYNQEDLRQLARHIKARLEKLINEECKDCQPNNRTLVVLDDAWDSGLDTIRLLREACPREATILLTTRSEDLANRFGVGKLELKQLNQTEGRAFLQQYLPGADPTLLGDLSDALGGHALALKLAASLIRNKSEARRPRSLIDSVALYQQRLPAGDDFAALKLEPGEKPEENLSLALSYSYAELKSDEQKYFRALGALAYDQPFDAPLLAALWQVEVEQVEDICDRLRLLSLLQEAPESGPDWYRLHPLLRTYARGLARQQTELDPACHAHAEYYVALAWQAVSSSPQNYALLDLHQPNWMAALEWGRTTEPGLFARLLDPVANFLLIRGNPDLLKAYLPEAVAAQAATGNRLGQANTLQSLGDLESRLGNVEQARAHYDAALPLYQIEQDRLGQANVYVSLGDMFITQKNWNQAKAFYEQSLPLFIAEQDPLGLANTLVDLGQARFELGERAEGIEDVKKAAQLFRAVQSKQWAAIAEQRVAEMEEGMRDEG